MKEIWELNRIVNEKHWCIVSNHIVVALFSIEFDGKSSWVSNGIWSTSLTSDGGESKEEWCLLANFVKEAGLGEWGHIVSDFEDTMGCGSLSMHNTLWNSLSIEMGELVDECKVLQEDGSPGTSSH